MHTAQEKVNKSIFEYIDQRLTNGTSTSPSFFINIGWQFPYLLTVAPTWCKKNVSLVFPADDYRLGLVVNNLLSPHQQVYKNVLVYLREEKLNAILVNHRHKDEASFNRVCRYALTELNYIDGDAIDKDETLINLISKRPT